MLQNMSRSRSLTRPMLKIILEERSKGETPIKNATGNGSVLLIKGYIMSIFVSLLHGPEYIEIDSISFSNICMYYVQLNSERNS